MSDDNKTEIEKTWTSRANLSRRGFVVSATGAGLSGFGFLRAAARSSFVQTDTSRLSALPLPRGIRSRTINNNNGLMVHILEAGFETPGRPAVLLLHGFPELAYSWRKVIPRLADR